MPEAGGSSRRIDYTGARRLILLLGLLVLALVAVVSYIRGVEPVEVAATILFIPVFLSFLFFKVPGGVAAGIVAAGAYLLLRWPGIQTVGFDVFARTFVARAIAYPAFGLLGGWAVSQLDSSLRKLELYDQIDDATGLFNARFFVQDTELEMSRSKRYQTVFSVGLVDIPGSALDGVGRRRQAATMRELGQALRSSVRLVDRPVHAFDGDRHRIAVVLPETGAAGAQVFTERLADRLVDLLVKRGAAVARDGLALTWVTFPDDPTRLEQVRSQFLSIDRAEHPVPPSGGNGAAPA